MTESKRDTVVMARAMPPRTTPPATSEYRKLRSDGVTTASATDGRARVAAEAADRPATSAFLLI